MRKKRGAKAPEPARDRPRGVAPGEGRAHGRRYPTLGQVLRAGALAAAGGLSLAGCAEPVCGSDAVEELVTHGGAGFGSLLDLELARGVEQLGVGLGISPHPHPPSVAGLMVPVAPAGPHLPDRPETPQDPADPLP